MPAQFDLDDIDSVESTQSAATLNPTTTTDVDLDHNFAITSQSLDWGTATPISLGDGLDRIRPKAGEVVRFAIVPGSAPQMGKVHFIALAGKTARSYLCGGAACMACKSGDAPKTSIVALVTQYTNAEAATGKLGSDLAPTYKVGYLNLSPTAFNAILEAPVEGSRPADVDYAMAFDGRRYSFRVIAASARHIQRKETSQILAQAKPFEARLGNKLGSPMPANAVLAVAPPVADGMDD